MDVATTVNNDISMVVMALKNKDYAAVRDLIPNYSSDVTGFLHDLYDAAYPDLNEGSIPAFIQIVGEANSNAQSCTDSDVLLAYALVQIMLECKFY